MDANRTITNLQLAGDVTMNAPLIEQQRESYQQQAQLSLLPTLNPLPSSVRAFQSRILSFTSVR